ncbi:hypothetical protein BJX70DRAFT_184411 [Aspergillus crustosus]
MDDDQLRRPHVLLIRDSMVSNRNSRLNFKHTQHNPTLPTFPSIFLSFCALYFQYLCSDIVDIASIPEYLPIYPSAPEPKSQGRTPDRSDPMRKPPESPLQLTHLSTFLSKLEQPSSRPHDSSQPTIQSHTLLNLTRLSSPLYPVKGSRVRNTQNHTSHGSRRTPSPTPA